MKMISRSDLWQCGVMFCRRKEVCVCINCYQLFPPSFFPAFVSPLVAAGRLTSLLQAREVLGTGTRTSFEHAVFLQDDNSFDKNA